MIYNDYGPKIKDKGWSPDAEMESTDSSEDWKLLFLFIIILYTLIIS